LPSGAEATWQIQKKDFPRASRLTTEMASSKVYQSAQAALTLARVSSKSQARSKAKGKPKPKQKARLAPFGPLAVSEPPPSPASMPVQTRES
jgi:hypothetical protein